MPFDESSIRFAVAADARSIAEVHVAASKITYRSIFPASVLEAFSVEKRETFWKELLSANRPDPITLVACGSAGEVTGFACGGAERSATLPCNGELHAIYLLEAAQRRGLELCWCEDSPASFSSEDSPRWRSGYWRSTSIGNSMNPSARP